MSFPRVCRFVVLRLRRRFRGRVSVFWFVLGFYTLVLLGAIFGIAVQWILLDFQTNKNSIKDYVDRMVISYFLFYSLICCPCTVHPSLDGPCRPFG